jgi:hypothetical protein
MRFPRASGILLHPTSLPGPHGSGDLGEGARHFVDWLAAAGQSLWQMLPLGGIGPGNSPYMSPSAFAGNELLIDLHELQAQGWLDRSDLEPAQGLDAAWLDFAAVVPFRMQRLARAAVRFAASASPPQRADHDAFWRRRPTGCRTTPCSCRWPSHRTGGTGATGRRPWPAARRRRSKQPGRRMPSASPSGSSASGASTASGRR